MKKKLQLKKEIVSILDRNQMNNLTKGGAVTQGNCNTQAIRCIVNTANYECGTIATYACPTQICQSNHCIDDSLGCEPTIKTANGCIGETDLICVETGGNCETYNIDCMVPLKTDACAVVSVINCE